MPAFTSDIINAAQVAMRKWRVPASITLAQWAVESGFGMHMPGGSNNPFGMKAVAGDPFVLATTHEFYHGRYVTIQARFRKFVNFADAFDAHAKLLATKRPYINAMSHVSNPDAFAKALTGVYATDPHYGSTLITVMRSNKLYRYDQPGEMT